MTTKTAKKKAKAMPALPSPHPIYDGVLTKLGTDPTQKWEPSKTPSER